MSATRSNRAVERMAAGGTGQKIFYNAVARAGLRDKGGIHCLRHSFATHWMEAGLPLFVLKRLRVMPPGMSCV